MAFCFVLFFGWQTLSGYYFEKVHEITEVCMRTREIEDQSDLLEGSMWGRSLDLDGRDFYGFISPSIRPMLHSSLHLPITVSAQRLLQTPV